MPPKKGTEAYDTWIQKLSNAAKNRVFTDKWRQSLRISRLGSKNPNYGKKHSPETLKKISENVKKNLPKWKREDLERLSKIRKELWANNPERKLRAAECTRNRVWSEESRQKLKENRLLASYDIWYGGVKYPNPSPPKYCIKWNRDLRERIRAFWDYKSVLSRKTKADNKNRDLACHHVYYQKKACCEWDEDTQGYYCYIDGEKYYIKGDPNKFVPLTSQENTMVNFNKMYWIKIFEDIIEKQNDKCFFTQEEYQNITSLLITSASEGTQQATAISRLQLQMDKTIQ